MKKIVVATLMAAIVSVGAFAQKVERVGPLNVVPGLLVVAQGSGFGAKGAITVGSIPVTDIVEWANDYVIFRSPVGVKTGDVVAIKGSKVDAANYAFQALDPATAVKVRWTVDVSKVTDQYLAADQKAKLHGPLTFKAPLNLKGEWIKKGNASYGNYDNMWDGGATYRMWNKTGNIWVGECAFSAANVATAVNAQGKPKATKFAFEDGNLDRNVVEFESDWAFALKKQFAKTDLETTIHSDPAFKISKQYPWYNASTGYIEISFPVK